MINNMSNITLHAIILIGLILLLGCISFILYFILKNKKTYPKDGIEALALIETILILIFGIVLYVFFKL